MLVIAGPGAGKTYCLIARIHHLITRHGVVPARICAVTFTNKAAEEIGTRLHRELGGAGQEVVARHAPRALPRDPATHTEAAGLRRGFGVADEDYQRTVLRRLRVPQRTATVSSSLFGRAPVGAVPAHARRPGPSSITIGTRFGGGTSWTSTTCSG